MKVFISHSSRRDPYASKIRDAIRWHLEERNHEVLVDVAKLRPGHRWRAVLHNWLDECDAAIVLLNKAALHSDWVKREVSILLHRQSRGSPVYILPVLIGVTVGVPRSRQAMAQDALPEAELILHVDDNE